MGASFITEAFQKTRILVSKDVTDFSFQKTPSAFDDRFVILQSNSEECISEMKISIILTGEVFLCGEFTLFPHVLALLREFQYKIIKNPIAIAEKKKILSKINTKLRQFQSNHNTFLHDDIVDLNVSIDTFKE